MTLVLDADGITVLAGDRARLEVLRQRGEWPPLVASVTLTEALTGDHRRDFHENRLLRTCDIRTVDEDLARRGALLRSRVTGRRVPSAADAIVVALAEDAGGAVVLTSDPGDLRALARQALNEVSVASL